MSRVAATAVVVLVFAACSPSTSTSTGPTTTTSSTTTTIVDDNCERVGADTVSFLNSLIRVLDDTRLAEFKDRGGWPEDLIDLERASRDLDIRVAALGCDPTEIQQRALDEADLVPGGPLSEGLIDVLLTSPTSSSSTTSTTTTTPADSTVGSTAGTSDEDITTTTTTSGTTTTDG
ncbi:MAG: hypothetical protein V3S62_08875 [Acidimicrobiia bacterium]